MTILHVPTEILQDIFKHLLDDVSEFDKITSIWEPIDKTIGYIPLRAITTLLEVCRFWNNVAVNTPLLWTNLHIGRCNRHAYEKWLSYSQDLPLVLVVSTVRSYTPHVLALHSHRIHSLLFRSGFLPMKTMLRSLRKMGSLDALETLAIIDSEDDYNPRLAFQALPTLKRHIYIGLREIEPIYLHIPWTSLSSLTLSAKLELANVMGAISPLRLTLEYLEVHVERVVFDVVDSVCFPRLATLKLAVYDPLHVNSFFKSVKLPALNSLAIGSQSSFDRASNISDIDSVVRAIEDANLVSLQILRHGFATTRMFKRLFAAALTVEKLVFNMEDKTEPLSGVFKELARSRVLPNLKELWVWPMSENYLGPLKAVFYSRDTDGQGFKIMAGEESKSIGRHITFG